MVLKTGNNIRNVVFFISSIYFKRCFRCASPYWNEILVLDENISKLISDEQVILMFDLFDDVQTFKNKKTGMLKIYLSFIH